MITHIFIPQVNLDRGLLQPAHEEYLKLWRENAIGMADAGEAAASICLQATLIDFVLFGKACHDWLGVMDDLLMDSDSPQAYSETFAKRLFKFGNQYRQSTIHAIYTRWWIECANGKQTIDHDRFADMILAKKQTDGLIYDRDVSETILRHRMKSELTISIAMACEILQAANRLRGNIPIQLATDIVCPTKCPTLGYVSMEFFRLKALRILGYESLFPVGIDAHIEACSKDLQVGWCDFSMNSKVDAYMGTAKRTQRDKPIHSPLIACQISELIEKVENGVAKASFKNRMMEYASYLKGNPLDIPAFQMRDVPIRFGADKTPIEIICASHLISLCPKI